ncbi:MAG TPA: hypothetical protein VEZ59_10205, partial [Sphingopyxis sp.]|nr:hypothetical protein [Sphingopyxis sp.]
MISGLPLYRVSAASKAPLIAFMIAGLEAAGCTILYASPTNQAPTILSFLTAEGQRLGVIVYAFRATRTPTRNRPSDERSFQIKYGEKR